MQRQLAWRWPKQICTGGTVAKIAEAKVQHYVPQYYLRSFVDAKKYLYVVDRPRVRVFRVPTNKVGGELYFNLINVGNLDPFAVEKALNELETIAAPALLRVKEAKSLANESDKSAVLNLMASVTLRNPKQRAALDKLVNDKAQLAVAARVSSDESYNRFVADMKAQGKTVDVTREEMKTLIAEMPGTFKAMQNFQVYTEVRTHDHIVELYDRRKWQVVVASKDSGGFVTSDHPVCLRWSDGEDHEGRIPGLATPGTEVIFPLSPTMVLRGTFDGEENMVEVDADTVAAINTLLIGNAHNQVYAQDALFNYKRGPKIASGATLEQDNVFLAGGEGAKVVEMPKKATP